MGEAIGPGLLFTIVVALLAVATLLLLRSLRTQLRKVPPSFRRSDRDDR